MILPQDFLGAFAPFIEDQMVFQLIQGMMGVSVHVSPDKMAHFQVGLMGQAPFPLV